MVSQMAYLKINIIHRQLGVEQEIESLFFARAVVVDGVCYFSPISSICCYRVEDGVSFCVAAARSNSTPSAAPFVLSAVRAVSQGSEA